ncbi:MAG: 50S ribosomal protein L21 [Candidatus Levybacteria bacterium]|nr:50S ribosomal protein L21 [Candidatus Levybacteria bacterium]
MQYAVIRAGGKQYKVNVGDVLELDKLASEKNKIVFDEILLVVTDGKVTLGKPSVSGAKVEATLLEQKKGDKIRVARFKAKARHRRVVGFRPHLSVIKIDKIDFGNKSGSKKIDKTTKTAPKRPKK